MLCRISMLCIATLSLVVFRIITLHGHLPHFSSEDNPASFADSLLTRGLTYTYLYYFNAKLLVAPITLSYDWQMCSIPLVETLGDIRNFGTVTFLIVFSLLCWIVLANFSKVSILAQLFRDFGGFVTERSVFDLLWYESSGCSVSSCFKYFSSCRICCCRAYTVLIKVCTTSNKVNNRRLLFDVSPQHGLLHTCGSWSQTSVEGSSQSSHVVPSGITVLPTCCLSILQ